MTVLSMTQSPEEMENVHMVLDEDGLIEMVRGKAVEEIVEESEDDDELTEIVNIENDISIVQQAIVVLTKNPEEYRSSLRDLRTHLSRLKKNDVWSGKRPQFSLVLHIFSPNPTKKYIYCYVRGFGHPIFSEVCIGY